MARRHAAVGHRLGLRDEIGARTLKPADRDCGLVVKAIRHFSPPAAVTCFAFPKYHLSRCEFVAHHPRSIVLHRVSPIEVDGRADASRPHIEPGKPRAARTFAMFNMLNLLTRGAESPQTTVTTLIQHGELGRRGSPHAQAGVSFWGRRRRAMGATRDPRGAGGITSDSSRGSHGCLRKVGVTVSVPAWKPAAAVGGLFAMGLDVLVLLPRRPFAWREFVRQAWFVARVSLLPTVMLAIPYSVLVVFTFNILLLEFGAADFSGTTAAFATVTQIGPIVTVLVVAGAGATAMCADLGARTIREEVDAMRVMGINPIQALVVPRVLAATLVAILLSAIVIVVGLVGGFFFSVFVQHVTPGAYGAGMTVLTHTADVVVAVIKAALFGLAAGLIACYKGLSAEGGPAGVGNAVNETVVYTFVALFAINIVATAVGVKVVV